MNYISNRLTLILIFLLAVSLPVSAKRLALVIGNDNYASLSVLKKARNDADAMAAEFKKAGFEVSLNKDLNYRSMVRVVENFTAKITGGDEVVVFFAGHGVQLKTGNYLLPTDIEAGTPAEVEKTAYSLDDLNQKLSDAKPAFSLVIADACRAPLQPNGRSLGSTRGLSPPEPAKGQMVVYSASKGQEALDRLSDSDTNPNSVFTREFLARMRQPGVKIDDIVRQVQDAVEELAKTIKHQQRPALYNEARGNFYFYGPTTVQNITSPVTPSNSTVLSAEQREDNFWSDAKASGNREAFEAYIKKYPSGNYVALANANITRIRNSESTATQALASTKQPQSVPIGVIYSDDCDLKLMHAFKFAISWDRVGNDLYEKTYNFYNESISIDKIQGTIDGRGRGVFNRLERNASSTYEFSIDSVRLLSRVNDGRESIIEGVQAWDKSPTRTAFRCPADSFMSKKVTQLNLKSCTDKENPYFKNTQCFGALENKTNNQLFIGNLIAGKESGWGIMYLQKTGERLIGIWTKSTDGAFFQGFQFDGAGKLYNVVKPPVDNFVSFKKADLTLADIPKELSFNFSLPKCKKVDFTNKNSPTTTEKNQCLAIENIPSAGGYMVAEFNQGVLDGKMLYISDSASSQVLSMTFSNGSPKGAMRGDNFDVINFQGQLNNTGKSRSGEFRYLTSKKSVAVGKWSNDGKYVDICVYGGDEGLEDIGGGFKSGQCYSKLEKPI